MWWWFRGFISVFLVYCGGETRGSIYPQGKWWAWYWYSETHRSLCPCAVLSVALSSPEDHRDRKERPAQILATRQTHYFTLQPHSTWVQILWVQIFIWNYFNTYSCCFGLLERPGFAVWDVERPNGQMFTITVWRPELLFWGMREDKMDESQRNVN